MMSLSRFASTAVLVVSVLLGGCASDSPKNISGLEQVQQNRSKLDDTREKIKKANEELKRFQRTLADLEDKMGKSEDLVTRDRAKMTLQRLALKAQEAELDLNDLLSQNRALANDLDA